MALINCPQCGKQISDLASSCVHCGYQFKHAQFGSAAPADAPDVSAPVVPDGSAEAGIPASPRRARTASPAADAPALSPEAKKKRLIIIGAAAAVLVIVAVVLIIVLSGNKKAEPAADSASSSVASSTGFTQENPNLLTQGYNSVESFVDEVKNPSEGNFFTKVINMAISPGEK